MENDIRNQLLAVTHRRKGEEQHAQEAYAEQSRIRLLRIIQKKFKTAFIGSLSKFETHFGRLWGHGKPDSECSEQEMLWRDQWEGCRNEVLNNGNHQLRAVENELNQYTTKWNRFSLFLPASGEMPNPNPIPGSGQLPQ